MVLVNINSIKGSCSDIQKRLVVPIIVLIFVVISIILTRIFMVIRMVILFIVKTIKMQNQ